MKNGIQRTPWSKTALAILPGTWLILQQQTEQLSSARVELGTFAVTTLICVAVIWLSLRHAHRMEPWSLPAFGALLWKALEMARWLPLAERRRLITEVEMALIGGLVAFTLAAVACWIWYQLFRRTSTRKGLVRRVAQAVASATRGMSWWVWGLLLLLIAVGTVVEVSTPIPTADWVLYWLLWLLIPVIVGLPLAEREGIAAGLLVISCVPTWMELMLKLRLPIYAQFSRLDEVSSLEMLNAAVFILSYLGILCFLVVVPLGVLRSRARLAKVIWLLLPFPIVSLAMIVARVAALAGASHAISSFGLLRTGAEAVQIWLTLILTAVIYSFAHTHNRDTEDVVTREARATSH